MTHQKASEPSERPVVVTTSDRGVFFGYLDSGVDTSSAIMLTLKRCRMVLYWHESTHGVVGLAVTGPMKGSRVTPQAPAITLYGITAVMEVAAAAVKQWESEPWSS